MEDAERANALETDEARYEDDLGDAKKQLDPDPWD